MHPRERIGPQGLSANTVRPPAPTTVELEAAACVVAVAQRALRSVAGQLVVSVAVMPASLWPGMSQIIE